MTTKPIVKRQPVWWYVFDATILEPIEQPFHLIRFWRKVVGIPISASNLKDGQLTESIFFTNRDPAQLLLDAVRWGPSHPHDAGIPPFVVTKPKTEGKTAGFFVTDARGVRYLLKLDPIDGPELLSGAEVVTSKLLYALGYHVPSYEIAFIRPEELRIDPHLTASDPHRHEPRFTEADLQTLLSGRVRDGKIRASASRILEGEILGPPRFKQFRDCAEIRALKVAYAWVNDIDSKDQNALLVWDGKQTVGYLIDFGTTLGADAGQGGSKQPCAGWTNIVDLHELSLEVLSLGFYHPRCDPERHPKDSSVGLFTAHVDPDHWKPYVPNAAFDAMDEDDARWIAHRMAHVSLAQIQAAVSAGQYSHPGDAAYLANMLEQRRQHIVHHYLREELKEGGP